MLLCKKTYFLARESVCLKDNPLFSDHIGEARIMDGSLFLSELLTWRALSNLSFRNSRLLRPVSRKQKQLLKEKQIVEQAATTEAKAEAGLCLIFLQTRDFTPANVLAQVVSDSDVHSSKQIKHRELISRRRTAPSTAQVTTSRSRLLLCTVPSKLSAPHVILGLAWAEVLSAW